MTHNLVIIPTYNERDNITPLITDILKLPNEFDILLIDDNSPDGTSECIQAFQLDSPLGSRVHLLKRPGKMGLGSAYRDGYQWALERNYAIICQMDADFSHQPATLAQFVREVDQVDFVLGSRYVPGGHTVGWPWYRLWLSRLANLYARYATGYQIYDLTGGFKCFKRRVISSLVSLPIKADGYAFQIETTVYALINGYKAKEIPITFTEREKGKSKLSKHVIWEAIFSVLKLAANTKSTDAKSE
ncbi:MAG: polyprenol monophosphomannose synthase [Bdellovibrionales bacterium]|nr:polyprenol monophosphomannose synthase [Bdellovibrionales bacterium]